MLRRILNQIFSKHPEMDYYQGYHDVCSIFLIIFGFDAGKLAEQAALSFFRYALFIIFVLNSVFFHKDNLIFKFDQSLMSQMQMIMVILRHQDPEFSNFLADFE